MRPASAGANSSSGPGPPTGRRRATRSAGRPSPTPSNPALTPPSTRPSSRPAPRNSQQHDLFRVLECFTQLCKAVARWFPGLKVLDLGWTELGPGGGHRLLDAPSLPRLRELYLDENHLGNAVVERLA